MVRSIALLLVALSSAGIGGTDALSAADIAAIRSTIEVYRTAWLRNSEAAVMGTFADDAVIMPHHGGQPSVGLAAIRAYWFSPGPKTTITRFELTIDEVEGAGEMAFVRGRSAVQWTVEGSAGVERWTNSGTFVNVMVKRAGRWKTRVQIWDDPPNRRDP